MSMLFKRIKDWATSITAFRTGDVIPVDGPNGTAKMGKDDLLRVTAGNTLAGNVAEVFVPNVTNAVAGMPYVYGDKFYVAKDYYSGVWDASKFLQLPASKIFSNGRYVELVSNAYLGYYADVGGGSVVVTYRVHTRGTGMLLISKAYNGSVTVTNVSGGFNSPLGFYFDGVRVAIKNKSSDHIDVCIVNAIQDNFVVSNSLPPNWDAGSVVEIPVTDIGPVDDNLYTKIFNLLSVNAYYGNFPNASGGSVVIAYRRPTTTQGNAAGAGIVIVDKAYNGSVAVTNVSNNVQCPLKFLFDGTRVVIQCLVDELNVNIVSRSPNFVESSSLPSGWDSENVTEADVVNINPVNLVGYATEGYVNSAKSMSVVEGNSYYGNFPNVGGGGIVIAYRTQKDGTGLVFICKRYNGTAVVTNVSGIVCPFKFLFDGTRVVIQCKSSSVDANLVVNTGNFVKSDVLPPNWDAGSVVEIPVTNIGPVDDNLYTKIFKLSLQNSYLGNFRDVNGGIVIFAYRKPSSSPGVAGGAGFVIVDKPYNGPAVITNISNNIICPLKFYFDGVRLVVQNPVNELNVNIISKSSNYYESSELPTGWNPESAILLDVVNINPVDVNDLNSDPTLDFSLINACARLNRDANGSRDFTAVVVTDSHGDDSSVSRAVSYSASSIASVAAVHCGDFAKEYLAVDTQSTGWSGIVSASTKNVYFVQGNHEKGTHPSLRYMPTDETLYNLFVKPLVDKGYLTAGEYELNKCYYYHDFSSTKTRLIVIDEYRAPMDYYEVYWKAVAYDSSLPDVEDYTQYYAGDKVNVPGFTANSFEAVQDVESGSYYQGRMPTYKCLRGMRWIDQTEAQWFLDTLYSTPSDYSVVVALHNPFSDVAVPDRTRKFTQSNLPVGLVGADWSLNYMATDFIANALNAFVTATNYSETVSPKQNSAASYIPSYTVVKDFSQRSAGEVLVLLGGHVHRDVVWKHPTYSHFYQVTPMTSSTDRYGDYYYSDICLEKDNARTRFIDSLTCVSAKSGRIALCKLGVKATTSGELRDIEVFDPTE